MAGQSRPLNNPPLTRSDSRPQGIISAFWESNLAVAFVVALGFCWRLWLAHATFFNTDEAWHDSVANQSSLAAVYRASLALAHPPLMVVVLYFWRALGTSDTMLRLPGVIAGSVFCWVFFHWLNRLFGRTVACCGLIFAAFLPPMIALSAELRQYSFMLMFAITAAYFLEHAFDRNSSRWMLLSFVSLYLAMLSHYSAFLFAASLGIYAIARMLRNQPPSALIATWVAGQAAGVGLAGLLYRTHISKLGSVYPGDPLRRFGDYYLADTYFHAGRERLAHFLYRGTFGVFRFLCGQRTAGHLTTVLFLAGIVLLFRRKGASGNSLPGRMLALLLTVPFLLSWGAVLCGLYPYGRTRQCVFLAIFAIAGVGTSLERIAAMFKANRTAIAVAVAAVLVAICHLFSTPYALDMRARSDQKPEHMAHALQFLRQEASPPGADSPSLIFTDKPTSFQLARYLCAGPDVSVDHSVSGFEAYQCGGLRIISTSLADGSLTPQTFAEKLNGMEHGFHVPPGTAIWVIQAAWSRGLGEGLRSQSAEFSAIEPLSFDYYIEVFSLRAQHPAQ